MPGQLSIEERQLIQEIASHSNASLGTANTGPARKAMWEKYLNKVDPDKVLPLADRERRAVHARKADMARMALRSARARREKRQAELENELFGGGGE